MKPNKGENSKQCALLTTRETGESNFFKPFYLSIYLSIFYIHISIVQVFVIMAFNENLLESAISLLHRIPGIGLKLMHNVSILCCGTGPVWAGSGSGSWIRSRAKTSSESEWPKKTGFGSGSGSFGTGSGSMYPKKRPDPAPQHCIYQIYLVEVISSIYLLVF